MGVKSKEKITNLTQGKVELDENPFSILDYVKDGVAIVDKTGEIIFIN